MTRMFCALLSVSALVVCAAPQIKSGSVSVSQDPVTRVATLTYELENGPAVVTVDVLTNDVICTGVGCFGRSADTAYHYPPNHTVNRVVDTGSHTVYWRPSESGLDAVFAAGKLKVSVRAWPLDAPPPWLVVDLQSPSNCWYYADKASLPGGISDVRYKTSQLLMRKIPAAGCKWLMGSPETEGAGSPGAHGVDETLHYVMLTNDFYLGVYELTVGQHSNAYVHAGMNYYKAVPGATSPLQPVDNISYALIRGSTCDWPDTGRDSVDKKTFLGFFRPFTGLMFDLPTDAEWEYACRAGTATPFNDGTAAPTEVGQVNHGSASDTCDVGGKTPNAWDLYDMHGNAGELCMDYYTSAAVGSDDQTAPTGPRKSDDSTLVNRVLRGGNVTQLANYCRSAKRGGLKGNTCQIRSGFRLWCPAVAR